MPVGVPSPENPLFPEIPGYRYGTILPFVQRQQPAKPVIGTDESGKSQPFTEPSVGFALPEVLRSSLNELTSAVTLPGRTFQGQVPAADINRQAIAASLALVGAGAGARSLGVKHVFEPIEHDPFEAAAVPLPAGIKTVPVDHDPFAVPSGMPPAKFTPEQLAAGRETPVSLTGPLTQEAGSTVEVLDRNLGLMDVNAAAYGTRAAAAGGRKFQPSALALKARAMAESNLEKIAKKEAHRKSREAKPVSKDD